MIKNYKKLIINKIWLKVERNICWSISRSTIIIKNEQLATDVTNAMILSNFDFHAYVSNCTEDLNAGNALLNFWSTKTLSAINSTTQSATDSTWSHFKKPRSIFYIN